MTLPDATLAAFSFFNLLRLGSYLPQLWRIARDDHGTTAISYATWGTWIGANASTTAYAWVNLGDDWLALVNGVNTGCCVGVCALTAWKRRSWRREQAARLQTSGFAPQCSPADRRRR